MKSTNSVPVWRTSSYSASNGECVEVAALDRSMMGVRDSKDRQGPVLSFSTKEWRTFVAGVHAGEFDH